MLRVLRGAGGGGTVGLKDDLQRTPNPEAGHTPFKFRLLGSKQPTNPSITLVEYKKKVFFRRPWCLSLPTDQKTTRV